MNNLPKKYASVWKKCLPLLKKGRPGDLGHAEETVKLILEYNGRIKINKDVLVPVAMMHDIGHFLILPKHFKYITGFHKIANGKLVHMLVGAKIANDILSDLKYDEKKKNEIVDIVSMHDFDQLKGVDYKKAYNTVNKRFFHDMDSLDRYTEKRLQSLYTINKEREKSLILLQEFLNLFFYDEFKKRAEKRLEGIKLSQ